MTMYELKKLVFDRVLAEDTNIVDFHNEQVKENPERALSAAIKKEMLDEMCNILEPTNLDADLSEDMLKSVLMDNHILAEALEIAYGGLYAKIVDLIENEAGNGLCRAIENAVRKFEIKEVSDDKTAGMDKGDHD